MAGIVSSLSPCSIAIIPIIIGFVGGFAGNNIKKSIFSLILITIFEKFTGGLVGGGGRYRCLLGGTAPQNQTPKNASVFYE